MSQRLANQVRKHLNSLSDQYDAQLRRVPGYANLPDSTRRDLEQHVLQIMAQCLETNDARQLIQYVHARAEQVLAQGFQPEWFQQAVIILQEIITPLAKTMAENNFVWRILGQAQTAVWEIVARERRRLEQEAQESLARRDLQVRTSTEIAQEIASATDVQELFERMVTLIKERLNYYHVQIFRYEPAQDAVVLIAGYGEIGQKMLAAGHHLTMGHGVVGTAAASGQSILAADVTTAEDWRPTPDLPETKGELAVPIKLRQEMLGILAVQSAQTGALTDDDRLLLEGLCGQIAIAMESKRLIDSAQQAERLMRSIIEAVPDNLYVKNRKGEFILANRAVLKQLNCQSLAELVGKTDFDFYPQALAEKFYRDEQAIFQSGQPLLNCEEPSLDAQGRPAWRSTTKVFLYNESGEIEGLIGLGRNITARKQAEADLRESERRYQQILDGVRDLIQVKDEKSRIVWANKAFREYYNLSIEQLQDLRNAPLTEPADAQPQLKDDLQVWETGQILSIPEEPLVRHDGETRLFETMKSPIFDEAGKVFLTVGVSRDITERQHAEEELAEERNRLRTLIDNLPVAAYIKNRDSRFLINNVVHLNIMGAKSQEEVRGKWDFDFFPQDLAEQYYADEQELMRLGEPLLNREELVIDHSTGKRRWVVSTKVPLRDIQGQVTGFVGFTQDITERKQAEQKMEGALHEAERLYAAVSHEGWQTYRQAGSLQEGYLFDSKSIRPAASVWEPEIAQALEQQALVTSRSGQQAVAVTPLAVRGETIGALGVYDDPAHPLSQEDLELIETVAEQVALALESARLFDQTQRDAEREHTINRVTGRIRNARSVDEVLTIAAQELRLATGASRSVVEILPTDQSSRSGNGEGVKA
ncbi:Aerobic respiration control sensor protein ArcB [Thermoflexales bacterium]|nr:Aerobic respiration control sensor protein ArcB [Thermoflexales bacterium]